MIRELEFSALSHRYCDDVYRYARALLGNGADAEDATQEVLLRLWRYLPVVRLFNARAWLLRTTRNYCLDQIRKRSGRHAPVLVGDEVLDDYPDELTVDPVEAADSSDLQERINSALQELPENLRSVFVLYEVNGLRYREIAKTLEMPINSVKVYLSRAREKMRKLLTQYEPWMKT